MEQTRQVCQWVIGVGTDLVDIDRFRAVLQRRPSMARRLFTDVERNYAQRAVDPVPRLAARFAAKEATLKSLGLGLGGMRMSEIEVLRDHNGQPRLLLHGAACSVAAARNVGHWLVSLSHTDRLAQATVLALPADDHSEPTPTSEDTLVHTLART